MFNVGDMVYMNKLTGFVIKLDKKCVWVKWFELDTEYPYTLCDKTFSLMKKIS
jgi:hypothetical protein